MFFIEKDLFVATGRARMDTLHFLANNLLSCTERFTDLNVGMAKSFLSDSVSSHPMQSGNTDLAESIQWQADLSRQFAAKAFSYSQEIHGIGAQCHQGLSAVFEDLLAEFNQGITQALDKVHASPATSETGIAAVKAALAALNSTYENMSAAGKQAVDSIDANINAVAETFAESANSAGTAVSGQSAGALPQAPKSRARKALDQTA